MILLGNFASYKIDNFLHYFCKIPEICLWVEDTEKMTINIRVGVDPKADVATDSSQVANHDRVDTDKFFLVY